MNTFKLQVKELILLLMFVQSIVSNSTILVATSSVVTLPICAICVSNAPLV